MLHRKILSKCARIAAFHRYLYKRVRCPMVQRIAINGYGRIGQSVLRALIERQSHQSSAPTLLPVAINELSDLDTIAYLTRYDTTHGRFPGQVETAAGQLLVNGSPITVLNEPEPQRLPWAELGIDLVLECSGSFKDRAGAELHLQAGSGRLDRKRRRVGK